MVNYLCEEKEEDEEENRRHLYLIFPPIGSVFLPPFRCLRGNYPLDFLGSRKSKEKEVKKSHSLWEINKIYFLVFSKGCFCPESKDLINTNFKVKLSYFYKGTINHSLLLIPLLFFLSLGPPLLPFSVYKNISMVS